MVLHLYQPDEVQIGIQPPFDVDDSSAGIPFNILTSLVNDDISIPTAVSRLATPIDELVRAGFDAEANDGVYFLQQTFSALIPQIPHDHPGAGRLADVVITLMTRPSPLTPEAIEKQREEFNALGAGQQELDLISKSPWQGMSLPECRYSDVPASHYIKHDRTDGKDDYRPQFENVPRTFSAGSNEAREAVTNEWTRHHAFLARAVMHPDLPHRDVYLGRAFQALVPALEDGQESGDYLSADVPAAAVWLIYAGDALFGMEIPAQDLGLWGREGGDLWRRVEEKGGGGGGGGGGYSQARWQFWKTRFTWIEEKSEADKVAKTLAAKAVRRMEEIERARRG